MGYQASKHRRVNGTNSSDLQHSGVAMPHKDVLYSILIIGDFKYKENRKNWVGQLLLIFNLSYLYGLKYCVILFLKCTYIALLKFIIKKCGKLALWFSTNMLPLGTPASRIRYQSEFWLQHLQSNFL